MSYILDALRRADAQRERGQVPDLHAQPDLLAPLPPAESGDERLRPGGWLVAGVVLGVCAAAAAAWWFSRDLASPAQVAGEPAAVSAPASVAPAAPSPGAGAMLPKTVVPPAVSTAPASTRPAASPSIVTPGPKPATVRAPAPSSVPATSTPAGATKPVPHARTDAAGVAAAGTTTASALPVTGRAPVSAPRVPPAASATAGVRETSATPAAGTAATSGSDTLPDWRAAPETARRGVPTLAVGGSVYSELPSARMLILNGHVFREGDTIAGELVLEQIRPRSAVLRVGEQRYSLAY